MPAEKPDGDYGNIKRIRQACSSCRRKKVRCSGERPTCAFCRRLNQECSYSDESSVRPPQNPQAAGYLDPPPDQLAIRVASLESQLQQLKQLAEAANRSNDGDGPPQSQDRPAFGARTPIQRPDPVQTSTSFIHYLDLPQTVIGRLIDTFFLHFHNQPYSLFHETTFRQRIEAGLVPHYLTSSFLAWALRFSNDPFFQGRQVDIARFYAAESWRLIGQRWQETDEETDLHMVQALLLHTLFDFSEKQRQRSWIKAGITMRMCQDLKLMVEPDRHLGSIEKEERRRVFWSVYLLDKFMSCGRTRPAGISDHDCHVHLPCDEYSFRQGMETETATLTAISHGMSLSPFSLVIVMASTLGRCSKYLFDQPTEQASSPPLISTSPLAAVDSALTFFALNFELDDTWERTIARDYMADDMVDQQRAGHFVLSHALYHLCHCLVTHPFLLLTDARIVHAKTPLNFLTRSFSVCRAHALSLSTLLRDIQNIGCIAWTSVYGYLAVAAGTVHMLHVHSDNELVAKESAELVNSTFIFLRKLSIYWPEAELMAASLRNFQAVSVRYHDILQPPFRVKERNHNSDLERLAELVDYSLISTCILLPNRQYLDRADGTSESMGRVSAEPLIPAAWNTNDSPSAEYDRRHLWSEDLLQFSGSGSNQHHNPRNSENNNKNSHRMYHSAGLSLNRQHNNSVVAAASQSINTLDVTGPSGDSGGVNVNMIGDQQHEHLSPLSQFLIKQSLEHSQPAPGGSRNMNRTGL